MRASVFNLGCKVNQYECDCIVTALNSLGIATTCELDQADIYVVNTCSVTREAERKSRQILSRIRRINPEAKIFITGCASEKNPDFYKSQELEIIYGVRNKNCFLRAIYEAIFESEVKVQENTINYEEISFPPAITRARNLVKIQDGCDNACTYCIICKLRGSSRSRNLMDIKEELDYYSEKTNEVIITGINLSQYKTIYSEDIKDVIKLLNNYNFRFSLGSLYIDIIDEELLELLYNSPNFCPHFHLSLQSASTPVLNDMGRKYSQEDIIKSIKLIRQYFPRASIFADIIIGYPTESDANFIDTIKALESLKLSGLHIFNFSKREGTQAYLLKEINPQIVNHRNQLAQKLNVDLKKEYLLSMMNIKQRVIIEGTHAGGLKVGHSEYYIKVYVQTEKEVVNVIPIKLHLDGILAKEIE